ncbi:hypothetical protein A4H97_07370 [Niastella yeongjuensis]|uniref:Uncharacterized protein n=1 Tax=Niastella yeongjuensis TaxID=354355 RepID=A0A1V9EN75_9BACT|nr:hypothetical protein [Niastella yeongjuensis]OQP47315.1 hypothetical protein A4H97_07370 [Niastella yeongjuensis]SEN78443.1 hypothetical protein SAMN05660816_01498 [Niastella yeongjuensis]
MNLVENFMTSVDHYFFLKLISGDELGKIQVLSGFGNKCRKNGHCIDRNEFSYNSSTKKNCL